MDFLASLLFWKFSIEPPSLTLICCLLQLLLKPIVSQLVIDPPALPDDNSMNVPSVKEFDDLLVLCIGQMAVTAGSDLLWKPLNHEVYFVIFYFSCTQLMLCEYIHQ